MNSSTRLAQISQFLGTFFGASPTPRDPLAWINEILNPESITKNAIFLGALFQNLVYRYDPGAYWHVEEMDRSKGYEAIDPTSSSVMIDPMTNKPMFDKNGNPYVFQHSQGHLEKLDYKNLQNKINTIPTSGPHGETLEHQFSELKPIADMPSFVKKNININENSPEYKEMFDKLYPGVSRPAPTASSNKFVKVSQKKPDEPSASSSSTNEQKAQEIKKLLPKWDLKTMIDELDKISQAGQSQGLGNDQIALQVQNKIRQYQESIKPLHDYLVKNGYGQKTS